MRRGLRVLFVDDEPTIRRTMSMLLRKEEFIDIDLASDISEGISLIDQAKVEGWEYDLLVLDWWVNDAKNLSIKTTLPIIQHARSSGHKSLMVVFTSDTEDNVNSNTTEGVPVVRKDLKTALRDKIIEVSRQKIQAVESLKVLREVLKAMRSEDGV